MAGVEGDDLTYEAPKKELLVLVNEAVTMATAEQLPVEELQGVANFDTRRDERLTSLKSFASAEAAVPSLPNFTSRFGSASGHRIVLQFLYEYFRRHGKVEFNEAMVDALWRDLIAEIDEPDWILRGVANLKCFRATDHPITLGDGITIRGRDPDDLASLGFNRDVWNRICGEWHGFGSSSFVMVVEHCTPKKPDNLILTDSYNLSTKAIRALGALRLAGVGNVSIGPMWLTRPARFNVGLGGLSSTGVSIPNMGSEYVWTEQIAQRFPAIYNALGQLEREGYDRAPGNLEIALRAFMATYDRWPSFPQSQLLDAITALEAVLGTSTELSFRLAFRVSGLLAASDDERAKLLKLMKGFYDTRSKVVHGGTLRQKHIQHLQTIEDLQSIVRRLLRSFSAFGTNPPSGYSRSFFSEELDAALVHAEERQRLRTALRLDQNYS